MTAPEKTGTNPYSVILKTFMRPDKLGNCLGHISRLRPQPAEVVVSDDSKPGTNQEVYEEYRDRIPLEVVELPFDQGLAAGRNQAYSRTTTDYVLLLDDDHYLPSNIFEVREVLEENPGLGAVAPYWEVNGRISAGGADIKIGDYIRIGAFNEKRLHRTTGGIGFYVYEYIPNCALFRRRCLRDQLWDPFFVIGGEHTDFYLMHKKLGRWRFAVTPNYIVTHDRQIYDKQTGGDEDSEYLDHRLSREKLDRSTEYLKEKHGIKGLRLEWFHLPPWYSLRSRLFHLVTRKLMPVSIYCRLVPLYHLLREKWRLG